MKAVIRVTNTAKCFAVSVKIGRKHYRGYYEGTFIEHEGEKFALLGDYHALNTGFVLYRLVPVESTTFENGKERRKPK